MVISLDPDVAIAGCSYTGTVIATDADGDTLTFDWTAGFEPPEGMKITSDGLITWTPGCSDACSCNGLIDNHVDRQVMDECDPIEVTVSDPCDSVDVEFCIEVTNEAPVIDDIKENNTSLWNDGKTRYEASAVATCVAYYQVDAFDPDECQDDELYYELEGKPSGMDIDENGLITWDPVSCPGTWDVIVWVEDECGAYDEVHFQVTSTNAAPEIDEGTVPDTTREPIEVTVGCCITSIDIDATDDDNCGQAITYDLDEGSKTRGMAISNEEGSEGEITWCPVNCRLVDDRIYTVTVYARDDCGAEDTATFRVKVTNADPVLTVDVSGNTTCYNADYLDRTYGGSVHKICIDSGQTLYIDVLATDPDDCQLLVSSIDYVSPSTQLPPNGFFVEKDGVDYNIIFNATCWDYIPYSNAMSVKGDIDCEWCDYNCAWYFKVTLTDGCSPIEEIFMICVRTGDTPH
ncbi:hypothetical protein ES705_39945 [subsurface metagenome]